MVTNRIWCWKSVSIECIVSQDQSWTLISELPQGTPEARKDLKWTLEDRITTVNTRVLCGRSFFRWILSLGSTLNSKYWLKYDKSWSGVGSRRLLQILMSTFQSNSVRILTDFDNFGPVVTLFHSFVRFHMILTWKYCDSDEEFIKNSPLLNVFFNGIPDGMWTYTWIMFCIFYIGFDVFKHSVIHVELFRNLFQEEHHQ